MLLTEGSHRPTWPPGSIMAATPSSQIRGDGHKSRRSELDRSRIGKHFSRADFLLLFRGIVD
jgi:hypothetical protein